MCLFFVNQPSWPLLWLHLLCRKGPAAKCRLVSFHVIKPNLVEGPDFNSFNDYIKNISKYIKLFWLTGLDTYFINSDQLPRVKKIGVLPPPSSDYTYYAGRHLMQSGQLVSRADCCAGSCCWVTLHKVERNTADEHPVYAVSIVLLIWAFVLVSHNHYFVLFLFKLHYLVGVQINLEGLNQPDIGIWKWFTTLHKSNF